MCQDADGFMWFATETGLSRYDGTHFQNFDTKDGLPDNEVLKIFADRKGRVWIGTFSKYLSYYFQGKIHTRENDSMLAKLNFSNNIVTIAEDENGNVAFCDLSNIIWVVTEDDEVKSVNVSNVKNIEAIEFIGVYSIIGQNKQQLILLINSNVYFFSNKTFSFNESNKGDFNFSNRKKIPVYTLIHGNKFISLDFTPIHTVYKDHRIKFVTSAKGCYAVDSVTNKLGAHFLPEKKVSNALQDNEGNTWFSTLGEGVFKLPSLQFKAYFLNDNKTNSEVFSLSKTNNNMIIGCGFSTLHLLKGEKLTTQSFSSHLQLAETKTATNRLTCICPLSGGAVMLGFDSYLIKLQDGKSTFNPIAAVKSICEIDREKFLVGTARGAFILSVNGMKILDTVWNSRCTKVVYEKGKIYVGTLNGLFELKKD